MAFSGSHVVGFVGLGEMSLELATALLKSGYSVKAFFQIIGPFTDGFMKLGGHRCTSPMEVAKDVAALVVSIVHADDIDNMLFGCMGVLKGLQKDTIIMLQSTLSPRMYNEKLENLLTGDGNSLFIVDIYVFRGKSEVLNADVVITSSGSSDSMTRARPFLFAMSDKVFILEGKIGAGSKIKMVKDLLEGIHLVASAEAICLGVQAGIHPWILYDIITNAAGCSWVFKNHVPQVLKGHHTRDHFLKIVVQNLEIILDAAKSLIYPLPLLSVANQQLISGSYIHGDVGDAALVKVWEKQYAVPITNATNTKRYDPEKLGIQIILGSKNVNRIGFIGLGAMGFGMATHLLQSNFVVRGYDSYMPTLLNFENVGGLIGNSPADVSRDVDVLVIIVINEAQVENCLYGQNGAISALPVGASVIVSSTVSPGFVNQLEQRLQKEGKDLKLVDAPVSGGVKKASTGALTIMASGTEEALKSSAAVLSALSEKLYVIRGPCGAGSSMKMVNQLLAGIHIASAAEAMSFGARLGLNTRILYDVITNSGGTSWMFENRVPYMLDNDYTPHSALDIFVKDLGIISRESSLRKISLHVSSMAHQMFVLASAAGWGRKADSAVVEVYQKTTGVRVEAKLPILKKEIIFQSLPMEWPLDPFQNMQRINHKNSKILVVLDDDPTGTQTVHDIEVLTEWSIDSLIEQFRKRPVCFFILTNSRSLCSEKASALIKDICTNICGAAKLFDNISFSIVLRGDSTLRGHFPEEADAAVSVLGEMDAWIICPFFLEGGRYTIDDIHYVADSDCLVPAGDTEFAKDAAFGYKSSNLREWVEEKTVGRIPASSVSCISIQLLRKGGPEAVSEFLSNLKKGSTCIVNAASQKDMDVFAAGMILAELKGKCFLCRSAASFVSAWIQIIPKAPVLPKNLGINKKGNGGLIVVGSYVSKTTKQVEVLKQQCPHILRFIEISVEKLALRSTEERKEAIIEAVEMANIFLRIPKDTVIMTSRELVTGKSPSESLEINFKVGSALVEIVSRITIKPRYILAKGGITSSDIATKALEVKCAKVVGQALAGVPLWQLGSESRHPGVPYIVFPGNVGGSNALAEVVTRWTRPERLLSAKDIFLSAEKGGYAVGAFNVYNLEGVEAVVAAAEEENSPAILQIHPSALKNAGIPLVACCISAAEQASVPITVHFDHGNFKDELVRVLDLGFDSVMVDGSHLPFDENISYTRCISSLAHSKGMLVEAELGRLSGTEDGLTIKDYEARFTDIDQARKFLVETGIDSLAVCIGNVHGNYPANGPSLKLDLLKELQIMCSKAGVFLVLHGASGLSNTLIKGCIEHGVRKFNVNTEVRKAYVDSLSRSLNKDVVEVMASAKMAMKAVVAQKMHLFGSAGKA